MLIKHICNLNWKEKGGGRKIESKRENEWEKVTGNMLSSSSSHSHSREMCHLVVASRASGVNEGQIKALSSHPILISTSIVNIHTLGPVCLLSLRVMLGGTDSIFMQANLPPAKQPTQPKQPAATETLLCLQKPVKSATPHLLLYMRGEREGAGQWERWNNNNKK